MNNPILEALELLHKEFPNDEHIADLLIAELRKQLAKLEE